MPTAADSARSRDEAEADAVRLYEAAVAYVAARSATFGSPEEDDEDDDYSVLLRLGLIMALRLLRTRKKRFASEGWDIVEDVRESDDGSGGPGDDLARRLVDRAIRDSEAHLATVAKRAVKKDPSVPKSEVRQQFRNDQAWTSAAARTATTEAATSTAVELMPAVEAETGVKHELAWISRGDHRVRRSHRSLHGEQRKLGKPFKVFPSGQTLRFPGDPLAPLEEVINCRCSLIIVPVSKSAGVFDIDEADWDEVDSLAAAAMTLRASIGSVDDQAARVQAERDLMSEIVARSS